MPTTNISIKVYIVVASLLLCIVVAKDFCDSEPCEPGFFCLQPNFTCLECPKGTFQPEIGRSPSCKNHTADPTDKQQSYRLVQAGTSIVDNIWEPIDNNKTIDVVAPTADPQIGKQSQSSNHEIVIIVLATVLALFLVMGVIIGLLLWRRTRTCGINQQQNEIRVNDEELQTLEASH